MLVFLQKYQANSYNMYTEDLVQTHRGLMFAAQVSVSPYETCLVDSVDLSFLVYTTPSDSYNLSFSSSVVFSSLKGKDPMEIPPPQNV